MNQKNLFCIAALKIGKDCSGLIRKNLKPGFYLFNNRCRLENDKIVLNPEFNIEDNIYGKNIFLHAIVGMNGSGKSSLLELIYRMVNNFSYIFGLSYGIKPISRFILDLNADLYYAINNSLFVLRCVRDELILKKNGIVILDATQQEIKEINQNEVDSTKSFFYTVVTNYSVQSLILSDYSDEKTVGKKGYSNRDSWLPPLFHKNDGYSTSIVLNPYRSPDGWIDMKKEEFLTVSRLSSLLVFYEEKKKRILTEYGLKDVCFVYQMNYAGNKLKKWIRDHEYSQEIAESEEEDFLFFIDQTFFDFFKHNEDYPKSYVSVVSKEYGFSACDKKKRMIADSYMYLVYKTLSIASKYPLYAEFRDFVKDLKCKENLDNKKINELKRLVELIKNDTSHIAIKVHQVLAFLDKYNEYETFFDKNEFSIYPYLKIMGADLKKDTIIEIKKKFPPAFFRSKIFLYKGKFNEKDKCNPVSYEKLSSGEKQLLSTLSTCVYHMENLVSVKSEKIPRYNKVNLIFEEIEISFHPDFQRCFVDNLISMIKRLGYNKKFMINIILVTHSPFVLSDIPKQNILYLKNGTDVSNDIRVNPFAASICDVLHQSFFLENGFIGAFAQKRIDELIECITGKEKIDKEKIKSRINNLIGEPVIREYMLDKAAHKE